jgi:hypothetical protein
MNETQGFKEVNIAFALWTAFFKAGYFCFPEFPYKNGSIDCVFVRGSEIVVCEWKKVHRNASAREILKQTKRMLHFNPVPELEKHRFKRKKWRIIRLWLCDTWYQSTVDWWIGRETKIRPLPPFDSKWTVGKHDFDSLGTDWYPYFWLWAFKKG